MRGTQRRLFNPGGTGVRRRNPAGVADVFSTIQVGDSFDAYLGSSSPTRFVCRNRSPRLIIARSERGVAAEFDYEDPRDGEIRGQLWYHGPVNNWPIDRLERVTQNPRIPRRRNPTYTTREVERGKWAIVGPAGDTHKWFTSKERAEAWIAANAGAEVRKWTGGGKQERFDFGGGKRAAESPGRETGRDAGGDARHAADEAEMRAEAAARGEAAARVKREAAEQAERIRQRWAEDREERAARAHEQDAKRVREHGEREAQAARVREAAERMEQTRREAEERGRREQAEREAREAHMRSEKAREEAEREAKEAYERFHARERAAKEQQERERREENERRQARERAERAQEQAESDARRESAAKEQAKKQRTAREGKASGGKIEWVHVGVNTWAGFEAVGGAERALFTGVQKDSNDWFAKRRGQGPGYRVIGTAPLGVYGHGVHARLKAVNLRMDVAKNYGSFPTLEDARKAAIAEDRRLQGDPGFHGARADAERDAGEKRREQAEKEAARQREQAEREARENQRADARMAGGPWTTSHALTWSVTPSTYGSAAHAIGPDGKPLFCFAWRRNNSPRWDIYTVKGDLIGISQDEAVPKGICQRYADERLRRFATHQEPWPPRQTPRWQEVRDGLEAKYRRQEEDARRQAGGGYGGGYGGSYRAPPPPPAGLHGFKRYADLARMAAAGSGGADNERALAARLMAKMQAEWDAANASDREGLRAKWHRNPRRNPRRANQRHRMRR